MIKFKDMLKESKFQVYHNSYTSAVNAALDYCNSQGDDYDQEEVSRTIGMGPSKPVAGKTNKFSLSLTKGGKEQRKHLQIQIYNTGTRYELNVYTG